MFKSFGMGAKIYETLAVIRCFVDGLREWSPPTRMKSPTITDKKENDPDGDTEGSLLIHLKLLGVIDHVQELHQQPARMSNTADPRISRTAAKASLGKLLQNQRETDERQQILHQIVFPLLENLEQCYEILDQLPQSTPPSTKISQSKVESNSGKKKKNTTPPPLGMLSLNDYTNVACLLEFAVSASLVPCLEYPHVYFPPIPQQQSSPSKNKSKNTTTTPDIQMKKIHTINNHTTFMAQKRSHALPKSLAGRISKMALTWGTKRAAKNHEASRENLMTFASRRFRTDHHSCSSFPKDEFTLHQIFRIYNVFQTYNEMTALATTVGRLLLLDRFRPMLLPRHLSDVYLTLLIAERLRWYLSRLDNYFPLETDDNLLTALIKAEKTAEGRNSQQVHSLQMALLLSPLMFQSSLLSAVAVVLPPHKSVDCRDAALAYRSLLGGGASMIITSASNPATPPWLRLRLGQCLTKLAKEDLQSVVEVFVADARGPVGRGGGNGEDSMNDDVMTGAAARLARALCAKPTSVPSLQSKKKFSMFQEQLCSQFVAFLVMEGESLVVELKTNSGVDLAKSRSSMAMHLTLWATISQLPVENLQSFFIAKLVSGLSPLKEEDSQISQSTQQLTAMQSISAITVWLFTVPSSLDPSTKKKIKSFLFSCISLPSFKCHQLTMLGQTLRFAASFTHKNSKTKESALIVEVDDTYKGGQNASVRLIEITLAHMIHILVSICSSEKRVGEDQLASVALEFLKAISANALDEEGYRFEHCGSDNEDRLGKVFRRSTDAFSSVNPSYMIRAMESRAGYLVGAIVSLTSNASDAEKGSESLVYLLPSTLFRLALFLHYSIANTTADGRTSDRSKLPKTEASIELFGLEELLKSNRDELKIAATILLSTLCENCSPSSLLGSSQGNNEPDTGVLQMLGLIINSASAHIEHAKTINAEDEDSEELCSTTSIVLSLLVAVLELGAEKRSDSDELFFQSILPSLRVLSSGCFARQDLMMVPELAEMASHAMALIVSRNETDDNSSVQKPAISINQSRLEVIVEKLSRAESDLQSSQPPLRAKGVVSLRHIARSLTPTDSKLPKGEEKKLLITDVNNLSVREETALISRTLARICLNALADPESYVYLASIQTLVAISDVCPSEILQLMGVVVVKGTLNIDVAMSSSVATSVELSLTPEQRIKATEALIFMIRRRGEGISVYGSPLLDTMLACPYTDEGERESKLRNEGNTFQSIQRQTHTYFMGDQNGEPEESMHSHSDEKKIRLDTGGPVFAMEENDVLRAGAISVVYEVVSLLDPAIVARYCYILVGLATDALQLDTSRPVRRVAACLARELYACTMREVTAENGVNEECASSMAVAIVNANEEKMYDALSRCISADELAVNTKTRLVDPATQSRSAEAIETRLELKAMGVLQAAAAIAYSLEQELNDPTIQAVQRALSSGAL